MSSAVSVFVCHLQAINKCLARKVARFGSLDGFPCFNHHWIAIELLYNMRLEPCFSIEWFLSYTLTKLTKSTFQHTIHNKCIDHYIQMNEHYFSFSKLSRYESEALLMPWCLHN